MTFTLFKKSIFALLLFSLLLGVSAASFEMPVKKVTIYTSSAFVKKAMPIETSSGQQTIRLYLPAEADSETLLFVDDGASINQISLGSEVEKDKSIIQQAIEANIGEKVSLLASSFSFEGTISKILNDSYVVVDNPKLSDSNLSISSKQSLLVPINTLVSMSLSKMPGFAEKKILERNYLDVYETVAKAKRNGELYYFLNSSFWGPSYSMLLDDDSTAILIYWANVSNNSNEDWNSIDLSIVAGSPNLKANNYGYRNSYSAKSLAYDMADEAAAPSVSGGQFNYQEISQQHIYSLKRGVTIPKESKVIIPISSNKINYTEEYLWNSQYEQSPKYSLKFINTTKEPLSEGWVSVLKDGTPLGGNNLSWTQTDENASLYLAPALDVKVERKQDTKTDNQPGMTSTHYSISMKMSNRKSKAIILDVKDYLPAEAKNYLSSIKEDKIEQNSIEWKVPLDSGETKTIEFSYDIIYYTKYAYSSAQAVQGG